MMKINNSKFNVAVANSCITMKELSELSGVNVTTLSRINSGKQIPSLKTIGRIAKALNVSVESIIGSN